MTEKLSTDSASDGSATSLHSGYDWKKLKQEAEVRDSSLAGYLDDQVLTMRVRMLDEDEKFAKCMSQCDKKCKTPPDRDPTEAEKAAWCSTCLAAYQKLDAVTTKALEWEAMRSTFKAAPPTMPAA